MEDKKILELPYLIINESNLNTNENNNIIDNKPKEDYIPINENNNDSLINSLENTSMMKSKENKIRLRRSLDVKNIDMRNKNVENDNDRNDDIKNKNTICESINNNPYLRNDSVYKKLLNKKRDIDEKVRSSEIKKPTQDDALDFIYEPITKYPFPMFVKKKFYFLNTENILVQASKFANLYLNYALNTQSSVAFSFVNDSILKDYYKTNLPRDDDSVIEYFSKTEMTYSLDYLAILTKYNELDIMVTYKTLLSKQIPIITSGANENLTSYRFKNFRDIIPVCQIPIEYDRYMQLNKNYLNGEKILFGDICRHEGTLCHETFCAEHHKSQWDNNPMIGEIFYKHPIGVPLREPKRISTKKLLEFL